jgi:hypothetical protein
MDGPDDSGGSDQSDQPDRPPLRLVRGDASPEELAALLAVLSAAGGGEEEAVAPRRSEWVSRERGLRRAPAPGRGAWRASAWPR